MDEKKFLTALRSIQEISKSRTEPIKMEEIQSCFKGMDLTKEQYGLIYQYLQNPQEMLDGVASKENRATPKDLGKDGNGREKGTHSGIGNLYSLGIAAAPILSQEQEMDLYQRLLAGDRMAVADIANQWLAKILGMAESYASDKPFLEELVQEGNVGLLTGLGQLLGKEEEGLATVEGKLQNYVKEAMEDFFQKAESREYQENLLLTKVEFVHKAQKLLAEENFTVATVQELADYTKMEEEEVRAILSLSQEA